MHLKVDQMNGGRAKVSYLITRLIVKDLQAEVHYLMMLFCIFKKMSKLSLKVMHAVNWYTKYYNSIPFKFIMLPVVTLDMDREDVLCSCINLGHCLIFK